MKLVFIDKNKELCDQVTMLFEKYKTNVWGYELAVENSDIAEKRTGLFVTASNPSFDAGGGLDAILAKKFKKE